MEKDSRQLPQNVKALIGDVGEETVMLHLSLMAAGTPWSVFRNVSEPGYDLLVRNRETGDRIRIEVKCRQRLASRQDPTDDVNFYATANEYKNMDVMVSYFVDHHGFYVVPKADLKPNPARTTWRFTLTMNREGIPHPKFDKYRDAWWRIHQDFGKKRGQP